MRKTTLIPSAACIFFLVFAGAPAQADSASALGALEKFFPLADARPTPSGTKAFSLKPSGRFFSLGPRLSAASAPKFQPKTIKQAAALPAKGLPDWPGFAPPTKPSSSMTEEQAGQLLSIFQATD